MGSASSGKIKRDSSKKGSCYSIDIVESWDQFMFYEAGGLANVAVISSTSAFAVATLQDLPVDSSVICTMQIQSKRDQLNL